MTAILPPQQEIVARLWEIHTERRKILKKMEKLNDNETDLLTQLQEQGDVKSIEQPDFSVFKDTTSRLLTELWNAPTRMLSHEDIRQDVIFDDEANDSAIRQVISRAKTELNKMKYPFEIKNVKKKGYTLVDKNVTKRNKIPKRLKN
jgi:DNA-binding winged helix-turn-helix (wHTH) protein